MRNPGGRPRFKQAIVALHAGHPDWTQRQIADAAGCHAATVRYHLNAESRAATLAAVSRYAASEHGSAKRVKAGAKWRKDNGDLSRKYGNAGSAQQSAGAQAVDPELVNTAEA